MTDDMEKAQAREQLFAQAHEGTQAALLGAQQFAVTPEAMEAMHKAEGQYKADREREQDMGLRNAALTAASYVMHSSNASADEVLDRARDFMAFLKPSTN